MVTVRVGDATATARATGGIGDAPPSARGARVHLTVVSPSKRAGGTVDSDVDGGRDGTNGHEPPSDNGHRADGSPAVAASGTNGGPDGSDDSPALGRTRRRSTVTPGMSVVAERGTASVRGVSSSSITRRPLEDAEAAAEEMTSGVGSDVASAHGGSGVDGPAPRSPSSRPPPTHRSPIRRRSLRTRSPRRCRCPRHGRPERQAFARRRALGRTDHAAGGHPRWCPVATQHRVPRDHRPGKSRRPSRPTSRTVPHQIAPVPRLLGRRPRVRRVTRVVRHVDPWSVFKVALVFNLVLYAVLLTAGVLLWNVANATGTVDNLERFFESFGWSDFQFDGGAIYHASWIAGLFGVIALTGAAVLAATLFNLITDLVGGIRHDRAGGGGRRAHDLADAPLRRAPPDRRRCRSRGRHAPRDRTACRCRRTRSRTGAVDCTTGRGYSSVG